MNDFEREDLSFIVNLSEQEWEDFMGQSSIEDLAYALLLITKGQNEAEIKEMEVLEQAEYDTIDCSQALEIINRVKKGVSK
jgi:hypothetical protein